mgnify:CR=1 FL=1
MGAFANGYPARTLEQFKQLHASDVRGIASLTETSLVESLCFMKLSFLGVRKGRLLSQSAFSICSVD